MAKKRKQAGKSHEPEPLARIRTVFLFVIGFLSLVGLADATYLTAAHLSGITSLCGDSLGCSQVLGSRYASIAGIPTAVFGMIGYFLAFSATTLALFEYRWAMSLLAGVVTVMFIGTLWFLYLQAGVLHAFCPFCLLSAGLVFGMAGLLLANPRSR